MKKLLSVTLLVFLGFSLYAQKPGRQLWKDMQFGQGVTDVVTIDGSDKTTFLVAKSHQGTIDVYQFDGREVRKKAGSTINLKAGNWALEHYSIGYNDFLFVSYADFGQAEVYRLGSHFNLGTKIWSTERWEKGIDRTSIIETQNNHKYLFLMRKSTGWAWTFKINNDGSIGSTAWSTNSWYKGIEGVSSMHNSSGGYLLLSRPESGQAWITKFNDQGKMEKHVWKTDSWYKGISVIEGVDAMDMYFILSLPSKGYAWMFNPDYYGNNPEQTWKTTGWEKDIEIVESFRWKGLDYMLLIKPNLGISWIFEIKH